jgi:levansucrase
MALTAPDRGDAALRHFEAKIHLLERRGESWADLGPAMPNGSVPYEREWAGSALLNGDRLTLFFTAAGSAARSRGYQQELWEASATLGADGLPSRWSEPKPSITRHDPRYMLADEQEGEPGKIKAFRDPAWFRDPADGAEYLAFTASLAGSESPYNGAFGLARRETPGWCLMPPPITADGVNNELERAHLVHHDGRYYAFWSTQTSTFAPGLGHAPNGLYGMVADAIMGPYRPLNGTGLVLANPATCPAQTYSWFVDATLTVCSFVDMVPGAAGEAARFVGLPAPLLRLDLSGDRARLCSARAMASQ